MRRRKSLHLNPKHGLIIGLVICIILILISFRFSKYLYPVRNAVGTAITPMQKGINIVGTYISDSLKTLRDIQPKTQISDAMSRDMGKRGFKFRGSTICYAFMQAVGMVDDHLDNCWRKK